MIMIYKHLRSTALLLALLLFGLIPADSRASSQRNTMEWGQCTRINTDRLQTLTAVADGNWQTLPLLHLNGTGGLLVIGFDEMSHEVHNYVCRVERCEYDWQPSQSVFESDWLEGFNSFPVQDYRLSVNTTVDYTHYAVTIPNEHCQITMSGNYRLLVFDNDNAEEKPVAEVRFMVFEKAMGVNLSVTTATDKDVNGRHQQFSASIDYASLQVSNPERQLHTVIMQNWHLPRLDVCPTYRTGNGMKWEHEEELIFPAGNEYHKFETLATSHSTMGVERMEWDGHRYAAFLYPTISSPVYLTDEAAKGFMLVRNSDNRESDITCDYVVVNYQLKAPYNGERYIYGQWTNASDRQRYKMRYDQDSQSYRAAILQKQGYYSYTYTDDTGQTASTEGDFFQTRNNYQMLVYYRPTGGRTWRLVGFCEQPSRP